MARTPTTGWRWYEPAEHEQQTQHLAGILDGYTEDCRRFARLAREARLDNLHHKFGLSWEDFCTTRLHNTPAVVAQIIIGVEVLGEEVPVPAEVARRVGHARTFGTHGGDRRSPTFQNNARNLEKPVQGNSKEYLMHRLRDPAHRTTYMAFLRGDYPSLHAACVAAGIVTPPSVRIGKAQAARDTARVIVEKWGKDYAAALMQALQALLASERQEDTEPCAQR